MARVESVYNIRTYSADIELVRERRQAIINGSARVFIKKGYHQATMREIAGACKMSVGAIYHYVGSKQDILYLIINDAISRPEAWREDLARRCGESGPEQVLKEFMDMYYRNIDKAQDICLFTYQETKNLDAGTQRIIREAAEEDVTICAEILNRGVASGNFNISNVTLIAHDIVTLGHMWAVRRWYLRSRCTLDQYIQEQTDLVLSRISRDKTGNKEGAIAGKWRSKQVHHI